MSNTIAPATSCMTFVSDDLEILALDFCDKNADNGMIECFFDYRNSEMVTCKKSLRTLSMAKVQQNFFGSSYSFSICTRIANNY